MLRWFVSRGVPAIGIEPAPLPAKHARAAGIDIRKAFFTPERAGRPVQDAGRADLILGTNVLAHVPHPDALLARVAALLQRDGLATFEVPYLGHLIDNLAFDTVYHEHQCCWDATA